MQKTYCDFCAAPITERHSIVEVVSMSLRGTQHDFVVQRPMALPALDLCEPCRDRALAKIGEILVERTQKQDAQPGGPEFDAAVEFANREGYSTQSAGAGSYIEWRFNDRERALLALLRKEMVNHRGIRVPIPNHRIT